MSFDCIVRNGTAVFPDRAPAPVDIAIRDGRIAALFEPGAEVPDAARTIDATGRHVFPGLVDAHVHFGIAEKLTEYTTETAFAAQGGFTTVLGYFLNSAPYSEIFAEQKEAGESRAFVDFGFHFGMATEDHLAELPRYVEEFGVTSFKYFMNFKGEEGLYLGLSGADDGFMYDLLRAVAEYPQVQMAVHPENVELARRFRQRFQDEGRDTLQDWSDAKPPITEAENTLRAMYYAQHVGCPLYFVHVSCRMALDEVRRYRPRFDHVHLETCPHYLTHTCDMDLGSVGKANPPLRTRDDAEALWEALADGTIQVVAADHVPRKRATKEKNIWQASQGFPGTAIILPVLLSEGYHKGRLSLQRVAQLVTREPARIFGIGERKGSLAVGADADLAIVDLDRERTVRAEELGSYSDYSLYDGWTLKGWPVMTMVRGVEVMRDGEIVGPAGHGRFLERPLA